MSNIISEQDICEIEDELASDVLDRRTGAILLMVNKFYQSDWVLKRLIDLSSSEDVNVKNLTITCIGHIARLRGEIDRSLVMPVLQRLLQDSNFSGIAQDALDDIEIFTKN
jgi:hypothetical protein